MDKLLAKLSEQQDALAKQRELFKSSDNNSAYNCTVEYVSCANNSALVAPVTDNPNSNSGLTTSAANPTEDDSAQLSTDEVLRLKLELEAARGRIARMDQELAQTRITKHTIDQVIGTPSELDFPMVQQTELNGHRLNTLQHGLQSNIYSQTHPDISWAGQDDSRSDTSDALSASGFNRARAIWGGGPKPAFPGGPALSANFQPSAALVTSQWTSSGFAQPFVDAPTPYPGPSMNTFRGDHMMPDPDLLMAQPTKRRNNNGGRLNNRAVGSFSYAGSSGSYDGYPSFSAAYGGANGMGGAINASMGLGVSGGIAGMPGMSTLYSSYQPQPIGTPLSPHAPEFTSSTGWKIDVSANTLPISTKLMHP